LSSRKQSLANLHKWSSAENSSKQSATGENTASALKVFVNPSPAHTDLIATYRRAEAEAAHKFGLIKAAANKGPKAIQAATDTAAKAAKRRDSYAKKLLALGVELKD
jgi:hypothetical protein